MLDLKKISKGEYKVSHSNVTIKITNPFISNGEGSKEWQLTIEVDNYDVVVEWFSTKREANKFGTNWVINN